MYQRWWAAPSLLFCISGLYIFLAEAVFPGKGTGGPRAFLWLLAAVLFVLAGLALRRLCTRRAIALGTGILLLFTLVITAVSSIPTSGNSLLQMIWGLALLWEYEFGIVQLGLLPQTISAPYWLHFLVSALVPFLWVLFGRTEPRA